ncbi:MAG: response regulator [Treponemataceae bacterium]
MYKVLIVDDEVEIRTSLARFLPWAESGFVVAGQAADGEEAKTFVEKCQIDVVFCDIQMPRVTGLEFARWAFESNKPFIVVFLSAYRKFEFAQEALRYGVRRYLVKPPNLPDFVAALLALREELDARKRLVPSDSQGMDALDQIVENVKAYIAGDPANATVAEAARLVKMSSHYLSTYFKEKTGESFSDLLLRTKMEKAAFLLRTQSLLTCEVSRALGYTNPKNFTRAFTRYFGSAPRDFKRPPTSAREREA